MRVYLLKKGENIVAKKKLLVLNVFQCFQKSSTAKI